MKSAASPGDVAVGESRDATSAAPKTTHPSPSAVTHPTAAATAPTATATTATASPMAASPRLLFTWNPYSNNVGPSQRCSLMKTDEDIVDDGRLASSIGGCSTASSMTMELSRCTGGLTRPPLTISALMAGDVGGDYTATPHTTPSGTILKRISTTAQDGRQYFLEYSPTTTANANAATVPAASASAAVCGTPVPPSLRLPPSVPQPQPAPQQLQIQHPRNSNGGASGASDVVNGIDVFGRPSSSIAYSPSISQASAGVEATAATAAPSAAELQDAADLTEMEYRISSFIGRMIPPPPSAPTLSRLSVSPLAQYVLCERWCSFIDAVLRSAALRHCEIGQTAIPPLPSLPMANGEPIGFAALLGQWYVDAANWWSQIPQPVYTQVQTLSPAVSAAVEAVEQGTVQRHHFHHQSHHHHHLNASGNSSSSTNNNAAANHGGYHAGSHRNNTGQRYYNNVSSAAMQQQQQHWGQGNQRAITRDGGNFYHASSATSGRGGMSKSQYQFSGTPGNGGVVDSNSMAGGYGKYDGMAMSAAPPPSQYRHTAAGGDGRGPSHGYNGM